MKKAINLEKQTFDRNWKPRNIGVCQALTIQKRECVASFKMYTKYKVGCSMLEAGCTPRLR